MKKTNRMIAMALAAAVATTAVPTAVFAETAEGGSTTTTNNSDGSTTTKTTHDNGSSTSTTTSSNTTNTGNGSAAAPETKTTVNVTVTVRENSEGQQTHKTTTTETTSSGSGTTTTGGEGGSSTTETSAHESQKTETDSNYSSPYSKSETNTSSTSESWSSSESSSTTVPDADNNQPGEPTGTGFANENSSAGETFASGFQEGTTTTDTTDISGSSESETTDRTDYRGRPREDSGSSSGQQTTTTTHQVVERFETSGEENDKSTKTEEGTTDGQPTTNGVTQPGTMGGVADENKDNLGWDDYEQGVDSADKKDADGFVHDKTENTGYTGELPTVGDLGYNSSMDLTATVKPDDPNTEKNEAEANASASWQGTFNQMVQAKHGEISNTAMAAAGAVSAENAAAGWVSDGAVTTTGRVEDGSVTHTGRFTVTNPDGTVDHVVREVKVEKVAVPVKDKDGKVINTVYDIVTTTTETRTPQSYTEENTELGKTEYFTDGNFNHKLEVDADGKYYFMDGDKKVVVEDTDGEGMYTYKYGEVVEETDAEPTTAVSYTLPDKPEPVNSTEPDEEGNWKEYKVVESYDEEGIQNGWTIETTIYKVDEEGNRWNIGSGSETIEGTKAITTVNQKEVSKETTIDTFSQTTTVTEREVQKVVTTEVVNFDMADFTRELIVEWLGATEDQTDHGDLDMSSVGPARNGTYAEDTENDDLKQAFQWMMGELEDDGNTAISENADSSILDDVVRLMGHGLFSDLFIDQQDGDNVWDWHNATQYVLKDKDGDLFYAYCAEMGQALDWDGKGGNYTVENIDNVNYFEGGQTAKDNIRTIALNGFWGTESGQGSLQAVKDLLIADGKSEVAATLTPGEALAATQAAIWNYGNSTGETLDVDYLVNYTHNKEKIAKDDQTNQNVVELFNTLIGLNAKLTDEEKAAQMETDLLDKNDVLNATITAKDKVEASADGKSDVYNTEVGFTLAVVPSAQDEETLNIVVRDSNGQVVTTKLSAAQKDGNGSYKVNVQLREGDVNINLSLEGTQYLRNGVYIYKSEDWKDTSDTDAAHSQTFVGIAQGHREVNIDMSLKFEVEENSDVNVDGSGSKSSYHRRDRHTNVTNRHEQDQIVTALVEVTTTTTTVTSEEWNEEFQEKWGYGNKNPEEPGEDPEDPKDPDPEDPGVDIPDEDVPLSDAPEEDGMVLGEEEEPMVLGEEEEPMLIAATGDSNHMAGAFGGMFAALAGMFLLRKKKEQ